MTQCSRLHPPSPSLTAARARVASTCWALACAAVAFCAAPAQAIGFGVGLEAGGFAAQTDVLGAAEIAPNTFGGGMALLLTTELYDENFLRLQLVGRVEGNGFAIAQGEAAGAGGSAVGDLLLRLGLALPLVPVEPFLEAGGGAFIATGAGTLAATGVDSALDEGVSAEMWGPAAYLGAGVTVALPLLPYLELRVGSHLGNLVVRDAPQELVPEGDAAWLGRAEAHLGIGFRI